MEEKTNFIEKIAHSLGQEVSIKKVYGDPIEASGKTIIPVAQVGYGFGGGSGTNKTNVTADISNESKVNEEGMGSGGGMYVRPKGIYEISLQGVKYIPVSNTRQLIWAGVAGFLIHKLFFSKKRKN